MSSNLAEYGVLGVGAIAAAIVTGLVDGVEDPPDVLLSPRGAATASRLAGRYGSVSVAADNQAVLDGAEVVLVCLRAQDAALLADLTWRPDHVVVSAMPGAGIGGLRDLVAPATAVARAIAMPALATRSTTTTVHPPLPAVRELFDRLGGTVGIDDEDAFTALYTGSAMVAPLFAFLATYAEWMVSHGVPVEVANRQVAAVAADAMPGPDAVATVGFEELAKEHATPGGVNEQITALMREAGVFEEVARAVETVHERLTAPRSA